MDWDFDGNLDILSGCYWTDGEDGAHLQILKGKGDMDFEKAASVTNVAGKPLQNVAIDGNDDPNLTCAICTEQHVVDYDGDGDLDVVMGCFSTNLYLYENVATESEKTEIAEEPQEIKIPGEAPGFYHSAPHLVDWDGDGDLDLLTGSGTGGVLISENVGTRKKPSWTQYKQLVPPSQFQEQFGDEEIKMGPSTRIWATDFNKDGVLDLLVGDSTSIVTPKEGLTKEGMEGKKRFPSERNGGTRQVSTKSHGAVSRVRQQRRRSSGRTGRGDGRIEWKAAETLHGNQQVPIAEKNRTRVGTDSEIGRQKDTSGLRCFPDWCQVNFH